MKVDDAIIDSLKSISADRDMVGDSFTVDSFTIALEAKRKASAIAYGGNDIFLEVLSSEYIKKLIRATCH